LRDKKSDGLKYGWKNRPLCRPIDQSPVMHHTSRAMKILSIFLISSMLLFSGCDRTREFKAQAQAGQRIVQAIEDYRKKTGNYPASLADLDLKPLPTTVNGPGRWEYMRVTNWSGISFSLDYFMGKGGVQYLPPMWYADDDGHETIILTNH
jgi:type II secretory pathway pseudopilin PulG